jgi:hypothetical protein
MIVFDIQSSQAPDAVLAALRAHAGEWRESKIPADLRRAGVFAIESRTENANITLRYERSWYGLGARGQSLRARATVYPAGTGAEVHVVVDYHIRGLGYSFVATAVVFCAAVVFGATEPSALLLLLLPASFLIAARAWSRYVTRSISRSDPDADYLVRRIESAVLGTPAVLAG